MNKSFENIFEKYNISYRIPKKKQKKSRNCKPKCAFQRNKSTAGNFQEISSNLNSSFYFNSATKRKYNFATRYKTLEVIGRQNVTTGCCSPSDLFSNSISECSPIVNAIESEIISNKSLSFNENTDNTAIDIRSDFKSIQDKRIFFSSSFNIGRRKLSLKKRPQIPQTQSLRYNQLNVTIDKPRRNNLSNIKILNETDNLLNDSFNPLISSSPEPSQIIETPTTTPESVDNGNTELNLLIDLIHREDRNNIKKESQRQKVKDKKTYVKGGGLEEMFKRALKCETVRGNFLKHDRKLGLRTGKLLTVVDIETAYGLTIVVVKSEDLLKNVGVVIAQEMLPKLKMGGQIETYFDDKSLPYKLPYDGDYLDIYLEPYKLLIV